MNNEMKVYKIVVNGVAYYVEAESYVEAAKQLREDLNEGYNGR